MTQVHKQPLLLADHDSPDTRPGFYYVSVIDGGRTGLVAGPFETHQEALDMVEPARDVAYKLDQFSHFYAWGTCRGEHNLGQGRLNGPLGVKQLTVS